jgi:hypothetical protein
MFKAFKFLVTSASLLLAISARAETAKPLESDARAKPTTASHTQPRASVMPVTTPNRSIYMNGVDISSARNQDLRNVHVKISENGDMYIAAPQYQVTEEETFLPLSTYTKSKPPEHRQAQPMNSATTKTAKAPSEPKVDAPLAPASPSAPGNSPEAVKPSEAETEPTSKTEDQQ